MKFRLKQNTLPIGVVETHEILCTKLLPTKRVAVSYPIYIVGLHLACKRGLQFPTPVLCSL